MSVTDFLSRKQPGCVMVLHPSDQDAIFEDSLGRMVKESNNLSHLHDTDWIITNAFRFDPGVTSTVTFDECQCEIVCKSTTTASVGQMNLPCGLLELRKRTVVSPPGYVNLSSIQSVGIHLIREFKVQYDTLGINMTVRYDLAWIDKTYEAAERKFLSSEQRPQRSVEVVTSSITDLAVKVLDKIGQNLSRS